MAKRQYSADSAHDPHPLLLSGTPTRDARLSAAGIHDAGASSNPFAVPAAKAASGCPRLHRKLQHRIHPASTAGTELAMFKRTPHCSPISKHSASAGRRCRPVPTCCQRSSLRRPQPARYGLDARWPSTASLPPKPRSGRRLRLEKKGPTGRRQGQSRSDRQRRPGIGRD
jgi:hypothetical protein